MRRRVFGPCGYGMTLWFIATCGVLTRDLYHRNSTPFSVWRFRPLGTWVQSGLKPHELNPKDTSWSTLNYYLNGTLSNRSSHLSVQLHRAFIQLDGTFV